MTISMKTIKSVGSRMAKRFGFELGEPLQRASMASSKHVARWTTTYGHTGELDMLEIIPLAGGLPTIPDVVVKMEEEFRERVGEHVVINGVVQKEIFIRIVICRPVVSVDITNPATTMDWVELASFPAADYKKARDELGRVSRGLLNEFFPVDPSISQTSETAKQPLVAVSRQRRSLPVRAMYGAAPWIGGSLLTIGFSLLVTNSDGTPVTSVAQAGQATQQPSKASTVDELFNTTAPKAWEDLPQAQKDVLLQLTSKLAAQVTQEGLGGGGGAAGTASNPSGAAVSPSDQLRQAQQELEKARQLSAASVGAEGSIDLSKLMSTSGIQSSSQKLSQAQISRLDAAHTLKFGTGSKTIYAFEDPNCGSCQHFASEAKQLPSGYKRVVIPVGFQPGGLEIAARALCSADPIQAWGSAMLGMPVDGKICASGLKAIEDNNALFSSMGFSATPTLIAPNGSLAQGSSDVAQIAAWIDKNVKGK